MHSSLSTFSYVAKFSELSCPTVNDGIDITTSLFSKNEGQDIYFRTSVFFHDPKSIQAIEQHPSKAYSSATLSIFDTKKTV